MSLTFCLLDQSNDMEAYAQYENLLWAWRQWELHSCVERHGDHLWELHLEHPDDDAGVDLRCSYCPAQADDLGPDGHELIGLEFDGVTVQNGKHDSPVPLVVPVTVAAWGAKYWTDCGWEYDAGIDVERTGPARVVES